MAGRKQAGLSLSGVAEVGIQELYSLVEGGPPDQMLIEFTDKSPRTRHHELYGGDVVWILGNALAKDSTAIGSARELSENYFPVRSKTAGETLRTFIDRFLSKIRKKICKDRGSNDSIGAKTALGLTALAKWLVEQFGISSTAAMAVAAAILIFLASVFKGAFCEMTKEQIRKELIKKPSAKKKRPPKGPGSK
jgi:hypothetical protein